MKKLLVVACLAFVLLGSVGIQRSALASNILADAINSTASSASWSVDPATISIGTIFGAVPLSAFDTAPVSSPDQWAWDKMIASEDGYSSATINSNVQKMMSSATMTGYLPVTDTSPTCFLVYDRYDIPLYDEYSTWNKAGAIAEINGNLAGQSPLLGFGTPPWYYATRYYDEWMQDADICLKLGDTSEAATLWAGVNSNNWQGSYYSYRADSSGTMECEVGFFAAIVANYEETLGSIPNFDRVSTDLYTKLLAGGWHSPLWGGPSQMQHATGNPQLRLENTLGGIEALQMFYAVSSVTYRSAFVNLLLGGEPAWMYLQSATGWSSGDDNSAEKAALLFLYGIIPDTGSLAIPTNEWHYEDWTSMMPSSLFKFNYAGQTIQIPVFAGNIKFDFGSSIASYDFPSNGVYQVQFSSDWNTVKSANQVGGLSGFHFLNGGTVQPIQGYGSIQVSASYGGQPVPFTAWYDSVSQVSVSASGYTFSNVPTGSHTVYGKYNGTSLSTSLTVSEGHTTTYSFDFGSQSNTTRPPWWPAPLPWPLPSVLSVIVSSPLYMFGSVSIIMVATITAAAEFMKKPKRGIKAQTQNNFSGSGNR